MFEDCHFKYNPRAESDPTFCFGNLRIPLGGVVWLPQLECGQLGRSTLLKLVAGHLMPTTGSVLVPPHLCVRMVNHEPMLMNNSLLYNLTFGKLGVSEDHVWKVATSVGLSAQLIGQSDFRIGTGGHNLSLCDRHAVCIARGLLADPDILLLQRPLELFSKEHQARIITAGKRVHL